MNKKQIIVAAVLVDFAAITAWAIHRSSWESLMQLAADPLAIQTTVDLALALVVCGVLIYRDAKQNGINPLPYLLLSATGAFGPLAYLIRRFAADGAAPSPSGHSGTGRSSLARS